MAEPLRPAALDPIQHLRARRPKRRHIFGKQRQTKWKHPDAEDRQESQQASADQQHAGGDPDPAALRLQQVGHSAAKALRQAINQRLQAPIAAGRMAGRTCTR